MRNGSDSNYTSSSSSLFHPVVIYLHFHCERRDKKSLQEQQEEEEEEIK